MQQQQSTYKPREVSTRADLDKQIEIEFACLVYQDGKSESEARKEAREYIFKKYAPVVEKLRAQGVNI